MLLNEYTYIWKVYKFIQHYANFLRQKTVNIILFTLIIFFKKYFIPHKYRGESNYLVICFPVS